MISTIENSNPKGMVETTSAQRIQKLRGRRLADLGFDVKKN